MNKCVVLPNDIVDDVYKLFISYAFDTCDFFMIEYCRFTKYPFSRKVKEIKKYLHKYLVKCKHALFWPDSFRSDDDQRQYQTCFYKTDRGAMATFLEIPSLFGWSCAQKLPDNIAFFRGNTCWLYSTGHEKDAGILRLTLEDEHFLSSIHVFDSECVFYAKEEDLLKEVLSIT